MRTAFVSTILGYPWGGADTLWTSAAEAAEQRGDVLFISVSPVVAASPRVAALSARSARIHLRPPATATISPVARVVHKLRQIAGRDDNGLVAALTAFRPDLVVFSLGGTYDLVAQPPWFAWLRTTRTRFRLIANWQQENPVLSDADRAKARDILGAADRVYFVSTRNLEVTCRHLLDSLANAQVIQNPLRWRTADVTPWPSTPGLRLATVSRLDEGKGIQLLLHALAELETDSDWHLSIYGQGPAEAYLRATTEHLHLADQVTFHGYVKELRSIWAESHLLVSPAIDDGVPMTIPEAMLCERPVLATAVGGAEDWLRNGETGFLCLAPTAPLLVTSLRNAIAAHERWQTMGQAAAAAAQARYRPDDYLQLIA
jgi:glycosyltransferase involved in cell wall biosynthesis